MSGIDKDLTDQEELCNFIGLNDVRVRIIDRVLLGSIGLLACYDDNKVNLETVPLKEVPDGNIVIFRDAHNRIVAGEKDSVHELHGEHAMCAIWVLDDGIYWIHKDRLVVDTGVRLGAGR